MARNSMDCNDVSGPPRIGSTDPFEGISANPCWGQTRYEMAQTAPTASVSSDLIGAWLKAPSQSCPLNRPAATLRKAGMPEDIDHENRATLRVVIGIDTHQEQHVPIAIDRRGVRLGERYEVATTSGYRKLDDGPATWEQFTRSVSKERVHTALASLAS